MEQRSIHDEFGEVKTVNLPPSPRHLRLVEDQFNTREAFASLAIYLALILSDQEHQVVQLRFSQDPPVSFDQIGQKLGFSSGIAARRLQTSLSKLRRPEIKALFD